MYNFIVYNRDLHRSVFLDLAEEYFNWMASELQKNYNIDVYSMLGITSREYVENDIDKFVSSVSSNGIFYLIQVNDKIIGTGALRKLVEGVGEIKRMYITPEYQGKGLGKKMFRLLLCKGKEFSFSTIRLETAAFMIHAQHLYSSMGFYYIKEYPGVEVPPQLRNLWRFMEIQL